LEEADMSRLIQIIQNLFLRLEGFFGSFLKGLIGFVGNFLGFFAKIFGLNQPSYFLESDNTQTTTQDSSQQPIKVAPAKRDESTTATRRVGNAKTDDFYLNIARQINKN